MSSPPRRSGAYGFDAPYAPLLMALGGACLLALSAWRLCGGETHSTPRAMATSAPASAVPHRSCRNQVGLNVTKPCSHLNGCAPRLANSSVVS